MKQLLNNKKYYSNGQLSLKKVLFGFLNEEIEKIVDHEVDKISSILINIGYIPCYNFKNIDADSDVWLKEGGGLSFFNAIKKKYKNAEKTGDTALTKILEEVFANLIIANILHTKNIQSPDDSLTYDNFAKGIQDTTGMAVNEYIGRLSADAYYLLKDIDVNDVASGITVTPGDIENFCYKTLVNQTFTHDDCLQDEPTQVPPEEEKNLDPVTPVPQQELPNIKAWYRFPQLNGGFFEMADSLLNLNKMKEIQDTNRKYKQYEKKGTVYGLIGSDGAADDASATAINDFFQKDGWKAIVSNLASTLDQGQLDKIGKIINGYTKRELGRILDEFFKNRMVKVGEYYLIDDAFLTYCCLIAMQQAGIKVKEQLADNYKAIVTDRAPKIVKAKFKPEELPLPDDVANADLEKISPQKLTIKQMFQGRADKNLANYNNIRKNNMAQKDEYNSTVRPGTGRVFGDDEQSDAEFENYKKNINRSKREKLYF